MGVLRWIPAVRGRRLTLLGLTSWVVARKAALVPFGVVGDQLGDLVLIEALAQLHGRFALGLAIYDASERPVMAKFRRSAACTECE